MRPDTPDTPKGMCDAQLDAQMRIRNSKEFVRAVLSGKIIGRDPLFERVDIKPVLIKGLFYLQVMSHDGIQRTTKNYLPESLNLTELLDSGYANILIEGVSENLTVQVTKQNKVLVHKVKSTQQQNLEHDRVKDRLLATSDSFLLEIGITDKDGKVKPSKQDKYRQIEEFLRALVPVFDSAISAHHLPTPTKENPLKIVDLGSGNAYLTFAAHQYFTSHGVPILIVGVDSAEKFEERNNEIAKKLGIENSIHFERSQIADYVIRDTDIVIALHACDTATDDAIVWGLRSNATMFLLAPCCQHDLQKQMSQSSTPDEWQFVTKYGIMKEKIGDILTDAFRSQILKLQGFRVEVIEFIGGEHTPRNVMIRAVRTNSGKDGKDPKDQERLDILMKQWGVKSALIERLNETP